MEHQKVYQEIKRRIIWLDLPPASVLNISDLAKSFEVSRTPVKEALLVLQAEGLILHQGAHFLVTPLSLDRVKEVTETRLIVEVEGNVLALRRISEVELEELIGIRQNILDLSPKASNRERVELDFRLHRLLYLAAKNCYLSETLDRLLALYLRFWLASPQEIDPESFFRDTLEMIRAVETKDEKLMRQASIRHIKLSVGKIRGSL